MICCKLGYADAAHTLGEPIALKAYIHSNSSTSNLHWLQMYQCLNPLAMLYSNRDSNSILQRTFTKLNFSPKTIFNIEAKVCKSPVPVGHMCHGFLFPCVDYSHIE